VKNQWHIFYVDTVYICIDMARYLQTAVYRKCASFQRYKSFYTCFPALLAAEELISETLMYDMLLM